MAHVRTYCSYLPGSRVIQYVDCRVFELLYNCAGTSSQIVMEVIHASEFASTYIPEMINKGLKTCL